MLCDIFLLGEVGSDEEGASKEKETKQEDISSTGKPELLQLPEEHTVMQLDCGAFHTGMLSRDCHMTALYIYCSSFTSLWRCVYVW